MSEEAIKTYEVDLSDGRTAEIDGPANATEEELLRALTEQLPPEIINVEKTKNTPVINTVSIDLAVNLINFFTI